jgi:hypothetical protein
MRGSTVKAGQASGCPESALLQVTGIIDLETGNGVKISQSVSPVLTEPNPSSKSASLAANPLGAE